MGEHVDDVLEGTTKRVFRFIYRQKGPTGIRDIQRGLGLSSPSVARYHVAKLVRAGLVKEEAEGYSPDRVLYENMLRIRGSAFPLQLAYAIFFLAMVVLLVFEMRPQQLTSLYVVALATAFVAFGVTLLEALPSLKSQP